MHRRAAHQLAGIIGAERKRNFAIDAKRARQRHQLRHEYETAQGPKWPSKPSGQRRRYHLAVRSLPARTGSPRRENAPARSADNFYGVEQSVVVSSTVWLKSSEFRPCSPARSSSQPFLFFLLPPAPK